MTVPEVANRATISGAIEIGRHPGVVHVTFRAPVTRLEACGLLDYAVAQYGEVPRAAHDASVAPHDAAAAGDTIPTTRGTDDITPPGA
jgi:hypothetical protein